MYYWELRRIVRQYFRHRKPLKAITYRNQELRYILIMFPICAISWSVLGRLAYYKWFYIWDETTGEKRYVEPREKKKMVEEQRARAQKPITAPINVQNTVFTLDD
jgi:hypothetical protein